MDVPLSHWACCAMIWVSFWLWVWSWLYTDWTEQLSGPRGLSVSRFLPFSCHSEMEIINLNICQEIMEINYLHGHFNTLMTNSYITGTYWLQIPKQWGITVWGASQSHQLLFDLNLIGNCCCLRGSSVKERGMLVKTVLHNLFLLNTNEWVSNFQSFILPLKVLTSLRLLKRHLETNLYSYQSLIKKKKE